MNDVTPKPGRKPMSSDIRSIIASQYAAALDMLGDAVSKCPEDLWADESYENRFWHVAYHVLYYTHLYLAENEEAFESWEHHRKGHEFFGPVSWLPGFTPEIGDSYTKEQILAYMDLCREEVARQIPSTDLEAESGFFWLPFSKLELQFYNIRHLQHHTAQLADRLRNRASIGVDWVGTRKPS